MTQSFGIERAERAARNVHRTLIACVGLVVLAGCSDANAPAAPHGPANGIIDVDAGSIPLGEGGTGANGAAGGSSSTGGTRAGGGGMAGTGGSVGSTTLPPARGVSTPCSLDTDCASPLSCHFDTTDYIADQQCTKTCNSDDECTSTLGKDSFCIGAQVCVHACKSDADCVAKTHCNDSGWCERGGPGSGIPYCAGTPTPCSLLSDLQCLGSEGCTDNAACSGVPSSCYSQFDSYSCSSLHGCYWSTYSMDCTGSAESCSSQFGSLSCADQRGCYWTGGCTGVAASCEKQFVSLCTNQPGCSLHTD
ncbi:MAG TPA: hypothetical protein VNW92_23680 [Polyangiaceae bacterium]|nr:hypothetical protein [Polyangiaceae bacterium]